jgi:N-acetylglutamate synthase-like GNAT family acetyltransferase
MRDVVEWQRDDGFIVSTDPARLDLDVVHGYLVRSYWAEGIPREVVERSITGSLVYGLYEAEAQVGFARVITDGATFAWICDVFVLETHRGRGLGVWLMECVVAHPDLGRLRRWLLATRDAHELYRRVGFGELPEPARFMIRRGEPGYGRPAPSPAVSLDRGGGRG